MKLGRVLIVIARVIVLKKKIIMQRNFTLRVLQIFAVYYLDLLKL
jgi:hypothetical protein